MTTARGKIQYDITAKTQQFTSAMNKVDGRLKGMQNSLKSFAGIAAGAFAISGITAFGREVFQIAEDAVEIRNAFERLNDPTLLINLRRATQGAISDLDLMKKAVSANNLGIPLKQMATLFEFATKRASETGESVDMLVNSIVTGIGRKSALVLDNLGIVLSTAGKTTSEVADEVTKLAEDSLIKMGTVGVNETDKLNASFTNLKETIGTLLLSEGSAFITFLDDITVKADKFFQTLNNPSVNNLDAILKASEERRAREAPGKALDLFGIELNSVSSGPTLAPQALKVPFFTREGGDILQDNTQLLKDAQLVAAGFTDEFAVALQNTRDLNAVIGEMAEENIVDLRDMTSGVVESTIQWQQGLMGVQGVLGIINTTLLLTGERMGGMAKVLRFLMVGLNIASSIGSVAALFNPVSAVTKTIGGATGGLGLAALKLRGQDIVGSVNKTNSIGTALGAN